MTTEHKRLATDAAAWKGWGRTWPSGLGARCAMVFDNLSFGLALAAGLVSFLSPCVLSLVPVYLGYLGSRAVTPGCAAVTSRWDTFSHGLAFVLGFSAVFVALGMTATAIGAFLFDIRGLLTRVGGVVVILLGLLARLASLASAGMMVVATYVHLVVHDPTLFPLQPEAPIIPILTILGCLYVAWRGGGSWSLDLRDAHAQSVGHEPVHVA